MKQVIRRVIDSKGKIKIEEIPTPLMGDNQVLISNHYSLISSGTELGTINKDPLEMAKLTLQDPWMRNEVKNLIFEPELYDSVKVKDIMYMPQFFISPYDNMETVAEKFESSGRYNLAVIDEGKYLGFISRAVVFSKYRKTLQDASNE